MKYTAPEMNIVKFEAMEVIVASAENACPNYVEEDGCPIDMGDF